MLNDLITLETYQYRIKYFGYYVNFGYNIKNIIDSSKAINIQYLINDLDMWQCFNKIEQNNIERLLLCNTEIDYQLVKQILIIKLKCIILK